MTDIIETLYLHNFYPEFKENIHGAIIYYCLLGSKRNSNIDLNDLKYKIFEFIDKYKIK